MPKTCPSFWAKHNKKAGTLLSLIDHSADVAACIEAILQRTLLGRRLARLGGQDGDIHPGQIARLGYLAALHDFGKLSVAFQRQILPGIPPAGHVKPALQLLDLPGHGTSLSNQFYEALPGPDLATWVDEETWAHLLVATICHHGRPHAVGTPPESRDWRPCHGLDPMAGLRDLLKAARDWFPQAFADGIPEFPTKPEWIHGWNGVLNLADWLGSSTDFFPFHSSNADSSDAGNFVDRMSFSRRQAPKVLRWIGLDTTASRTYLGTSPPEFAAISDQAAPRPAQAALATALPSPAGSIAALEASTGAGKTEAAMWYFARLFQAGLVDGMTFALPTRTAATQIEARLVTAADLLFASEPELSRPPVVLAVPGYLRVDGVEGRRTPGLPAFEVQWDDDDPAFKRRAWAGEHGKRYLAGGIVVGTVDQVLLSALQTKHTHLRAACLLRHLLVVDEVHASDTYMTRILEEVLAHHRAAGGHVLLMSATLGAATRHRLMHPGDRFRAAKNPTLEEALAAPYPLISRRSFDAQRIETIAVPAPTDGSATHEKIVEPKMRDIAGAPETIARVALDAAAAGARVLVLRNTVADCREVFLAATTLAKKERREHLLFGVKVGRKIVPAPHHGRFARSDRRLLDQTIEKVFGPDKDRPQVGWLAVGTQTLQMSLDLDADFLITDLCPMDVLLQRIGRLFRHLLYRPLGFESPRLLVLTPTDRDLASLLRNDGKSRFSHGLGGNLYEDLRMIEATWRELERQPELKLPSMNRELVERSTHPEALQALVKSLGGLWEKHQSHIQGKYFAQSHIAQLSLVDWSRPFGEKEFSEGKIPTRLGDQDVVVTFDDPPIGPFGAPITQIQLRHYEVTELEPEKGMPAPNKIEPLADGGFNFKLGEKAFSYNVSGLTPL